MVPTLATLSGPTLSGSAVSPLESPSLIHMRGRTEPIKYFIGVEAPVGTEMPGGLLEAKHREPEPGLRSLGKLVQERGSEVVPSSLTCPWEAQQGSVSSEVGGRGEAQVGSGEGAWEGRSPAAWRSPSGPFHQLSSGPAPNRKFSLSPTLCPALWYLG